MGKAMQLLGITYSVGAGFFWAVAVVLFKKSGETISPAALNLFKCGVTMVLLIPTLLLFGVPFAPMVPLSDWILFCASGFLGITLADTLLFIALMRIGAGLSAVVDCLYLPVMMLFSFIFLGEVLSWWGIFGALLVLSALCTISANRADDCTGLPETRISGMLYGVAAILLIAISIVMVKPRLAQVHLLWASFVRTLAGFAGLAAFMLMSSTCRRQIVALRPSRTWYTAVPASISGNYLAMLAWLAGMKHTLVSVSAILNQLSTIFIFILAALFLKEPVTGRRISATILAFTGAAIVAVTVS
jgi:drug/metabolite transporter (DMT)-like permease